MRDMDEIGLKTCSFQAELFGESVALLKCGSKIFIRRYMYSDLASRIDSQGNVFESMDILKDGRIAVSGRKSFTSSDSSMKGVCWNVLLIDPQDPKKYTDIHIGGTSGER